MPTIKEFLIEIPLDNGKTITLVFPQEWDGDGKIQAEKLGIKFKKNGKPQFPEEFKEKIEFLYDSLVEISEKKGEPFSTNIIYSGFAVTDKDIIGKNGEDIYYKYSQEKNVLSIDDRFLQLSNEKIYSILQHEVGHTKNNHSQTRLLDNGMVFLELAFDFTVRDALGDFKKGKITDAKYDTAELLNKMEDFEKTMAGFSEYMKQNNVSPPTTENIQRLISDPEKLKELQEKVEKVNETIQLTLKEFSEENIRDKNFIDFYNSNNNRFDLFKKNVKGSSSIIGNIAGYINRACELEADSYVDKYPLEFIDMLQNNIYAGTDSRTHPSSDNRERTVRITNAERLLDKFTKEDSLGGTMLTEQEYLDLKNIGGNFIKFINIEGTEKDYVEIGYEGNVKSKPVVFENDDISKESNFVLKKTIMTNGFSYFVLLVALHKSNLLRIKWC